MIGQAADFFLGAALFADVAHHGEKAAAVVGERIDGNVQIARAISLFQPAFACLSSALRQQCGGGAVDGLRQRRQQGFATAASAPVVVGGKVAQVRRNVQRNQPAASIAAQHHVRAGGDQQCQVCLALLQRQLRLLAHTDVHVGAEHARRPLPGTAANAAPQHLHPAVVAGMVAQPQFAGDFRLPAGAMCGNFRLPAGHIVRVDNFLPCLRFRLEYARRIAERLYTLAAEAYQLTVRIPFPHALARTAQRQLQFALQLAAFQQVLDAQAGDADIERFGDVVNRAQCQPGCLGGGFAECGDEDHRHATQCRCCLQMAESLVAVHFRHHDIEQDQVRWRLLCQLQRFGAGVGELHFVIVGQRFAEQRDVGEHVVNDQQMRPVAMRG